MAKQRTEKSKFQSSFGERWISAGQYVAEEMCKRQAAHDKRRLPPDFWLVPQWAQLYKNLVTGANSLIRDFGETAVLKALSWKSLEWCSSVRAKQFRQAVIQEYEKELVQKEEFQEVPEIQTNEEFGNSFYKKKGMRNL